MSKELYRYISFEDFINLTINNKDRFVRPFYWHDKYEGFLFSHIETPENVYQIVREMYNNLCPRNYYAIPYNYFLMWHSKWFTYAQCWSRHSETDTMWRCYSYGNRAVRIKTNYNKLLDHTKKVFPKEKKFNVYLQKVKYDLNKKSAFKQQINHIINSHFTHEIYFHKRPAFSHEGEYRLLIEDNSSYYVEELSSWAVRFNIKEQVKNKSDDEIIQYLTELICAQRIEWSCFNNENVRIEDAGNILEFIEDVMVHPLAQKWYVDIIRDICQSKKIKFEGQSKIYSLIT